MHRFILLTAFALCALPLLAQSNQQAPLDAGEMRNLMPVIKVLYDFRQTAVGDPEAAVQRTFEDRCQRRWNLRVNNAFTKATLVDFFVGSAPVIGSFNQNHAVGALYNPFWDTLLLLETNLDGQKAAIAKFAFVTGETFRGEKKKAPDHPYRHPTVISIRPLPVELASAFSKTVARFDKLFPPRGEPSLGDFALIPFDDELPLITERFQLLTTLFYAVATKAPKEYKFLQEILAILQKGDRGMLFSSFNKVLYDRPVRSLLTLPRELRRQLVPYVILPNDKVTICAFIPLFNPTITVVITAPRDRKQTVGIEVLNLNDSEDYLKLYKLEKGGNK